jgi:mannose-6-phosphate isomerase-like protein (cupin superfamily)
MAGMRRMSRREVCVGLPALAVSAGVAEALGEQAHSSEFPAPQAQPQPQYRPGNNKVESGVPLGGTLGPARAIPFDAMPARTNPSGGETRDVAHGSLATGETVNIHQSMQVAGQNPPPLHVIQHSEFICVREGELEFQHEVDGKVVAERVGPGGVFYVAFGTKHCIKNVGMVPAKYFVVAIGGDAK